MTKQWTEPSKGTPFLCSDGKVHTWAEMTSEIDEEFYPGCREDFIELLMCFGVDLEPWGIYY